MIFCATNRKFENGKFTNNRNPDGNTWWFTFGKPLTDEKRWGTASQTWILQQIKATGKPVVLFIHGFNESWEREQGIMQAVMDGFGEQFTLISFSWISEGEVWAYLQDRSRAEHSAPDLLLALQALGPVNVIAHSMGNFLLQQAVKYEHPPVLTERLIDGLAMVAADVPADVLKTSNLALLAKRVLVLWCLEDAALGGSSIIHGGPRLGMTGPLGDAPANCQSVNCSGILPAQLNPVDLHGEYFKVPKVYELMAETFSQSKGVAA